MNASEFHGNKRMFFHWHTMTTKAETKLKYHRLVSELIVHENWHHAVALLVDGLLLDPPQKEPGNRWRMLRVDLHDSFLPKGAEDLPENLWIRVFDLDDRRNWMLPHQAICHYWRIGWPRTGWDPGKYVDEPWRILGPIDAFLHGHFTYARLVEQASFRKDKGEVRCPFFRFVYDRLYPHILAKAGLHRAQLPEWRTTLRTLYDEAVSLNKDLFAKHYLRPRNAYTGVSERNFDRRRFKSKRQMRNPFLAYYDWLYKEIRDPSKYDPLFRKIDSAKGE